MAKFARVAASSMLFGALLAVLALNLGAPATKSSSGPASAGSLPAHGPDSGGGATVAAQAVGTTTADPSDGGGALEFEARDSHFREGGLEGVSSGSSVVPGLQFRSTAGQASAGALLSLPATSTGDEGGFSALFSVEEPAAVTIASDVATTAVLVNAIANGLRVNDSAEVRIRCEFRGERHETRWLGKFAGTPAMLHADLALNSGEDPSVPGHVAHGDADWNNGQLQLSLVNLDPARFPPTADDCQTEVRAGPFSRQVNLEFIVPPGAPVPIFEIEFCGTIQAISGPALTLNTGAVVIIDAATQVRGVLAVGVAVRVHATEQANGTFLAREIDVIAAQDVERCRA